MRVRTRLFVGGRSVDAVDGARFRVLNPFNGGPLAGVGEAKAEDVNRAVAAAAKAFPAWRDTPAAERGRLLLKLADRIEAEAERLARLESQDTGHPLRDTRGLDVPRTAATFRYFRGMADKLQGSLLPVGKRFLHYVLR